ncbi:hypothetical protein AWN90_07485 [Nocardia terpenica]|uniref:Uncharacterized protein n=1 Tax=Nocardia terpenica TaxID=455432 RepID=A0A164INX3_9NOCA|nr:hypothetical protein AWN90_07485 [Nocardia terpenica]
MIPDSASRSPGKEPLHISFLLEVPNLPGNRLVEGLVYLSPDLCPVTNSRGVLRYIQFDVTRG